jgi:hypothetical protein
MYNLVCKKVLLIVRLENVWFPGADGLRTFFMGNQNQNNSALQGLLAGF